MSVHKSIIPAVLFLMLGIFINNPGYTQTIVKKADPNETIFLVRTKQFNEFLDRFNYKTNFNAEPVDSAFMSKIPRDRMINSLFNLKDPRIDPSGEYYSASYTNEKIKFINEVVNNNLHVNKYSDKIIAEAKSLIIYKGIPTTISIFLSQEIVGRDMVKWVIISVKGAIFDFLQEDSLSIRFIPPASNETDFINMKRALEDVDHLQYYASKDYDADNLTLFFYMINSGLVKFEYVEEVTYHIIDISGWCIKIKEFNRIEMNSGWLISDISRNSADKISYLKTLK